jgi:hypothetical protein
MSPLAYFGIESSGLDLAIDLLIVFVVVLYFATIYWTYADARRRIEDPLLVGCAFVVALFPFVGPIVYMVVRPPEYLEDVHERELETKAAETHLRQHEQTLCPHCSYRIEPDFIRCPSCLRKLKERCSNCERPLDQAWTICPYCEADVPPMASTRARRRRGASALEGELGELESASAELTDGPPTTALSPEGETALAVEPAVRPRGSGRASRPGGRARPGS